MHGGCWIKSRTASGINMRLISTPDATTMNLALWSLLGFALWTLILLFATVGWYRWSRILTGRQAISTFRADDVQGSDAYKRAMRAHANCVENLPIFGAIVYVGLTSGAGDNASFGVLSMLVLLARLTHSLVHVGLQQTDRVVAFRFAFFLAQIVGMGAMSVWIVRYALT